MAASDPTTGVATPTGVLQGVAAFSWDSAAWQPVGRAGPAVATPTGALQGVAPFAWDGSVWQPSGRAGPGVATPTGVLDGVAVYTWSGSAWTPAGGTATPSTPSGALRGVAAFSWDGSAWQPAAQAGPSVATPYGVLQGVAMFNWSGTAWSPGSALPAGATLDLSFLTPGSLDPRITFTRASTATYFDSTGTMQTATTNTPRWDYNSSTHALNGLLIEEARTNYVFPSGNLAAAPWTTGATGAAPPVVTANNATAPDGTLTAARIVMPAVPAGSNASFVRQTPGVPSSGQTVCSIWLRGAVGGEIVNVAYSNFTIWFHATAVLTTAWQRVSVAATSTATGWTFFVGTDMRDATETPNSAQTFYAWGAQTEMGAFPTSYIPTTAASVTRAADSCSISVANMSPWFVSPGGSWMAEIISLNVAFTDNRIIGQGGTGETPLFVQNATGHLTQFDGSAAPATANAMVSNAIQKAASTYTSGTGKVCLNGGIVASLAMTLGYAGLSTQGLLFFTSGAGGTDRLTGYIRRARYWPRVLTNAELQSVTT